MQVELAAIEADLGTIRSTHRRTLLSLATFGLLIVFSFALAVTLLVVAADKHRTSDILMALGMGLLFLFAGAALIHMMRQAANTRVDIADRGLVHTYRSVVTPVRWTEIGAVETIRVNGRVKTVLLHTHGRRLMISNDLAAFRSILAVLKLNGVLPADFVD